MSVESPPPSETKGNASADEFDFDLVVLGAGSGGTRAARWAASQYGARVACVELPFGFVPSDEVGGAGGTCVCFISGWLFSMPIDLMGRDKSIN